MTSARSNVCISVKRIFILFTNPCVLPTSIQSPLRIGRSNNKIKPETKLLTMFFRPKPIPTDKAPAITAKFLNSIPAMDEANKIAKIKPT